MIAFLRRLRSAGRDTKPWGGKAHLAPVRARIGGIDEACPPDLVREVHLELLGAFGESIGLGFHPRSPVEPPSEDLISVFGYFERRGREPDFGLQLYRERSAEGHLIRIAWLIDLYIPEGWRRRRAGTALMDVLVELWEAAGVDAVRTTATVEGRLAYLSWGFSEVGGQGLGDGLTEMRLELPRATSRPVLPL